MFGKRTRNAIFKNKYTHEPGKILQSSDNILAYICFVS